MPKKQFAKNKMDDRIISVRFSAEDFSILEKYLVKNESEYISTTIKKIVLDNCLDKE